MEAIGLSDFLTFKGRLFSIKVRLFLTVVYELQIEFYTIGKRYDLSRPYPGNMFTSTGELGKLHSYVVVICIVCVTSKYRALGSFSRLDYGLLGLPLGIS